MQTATAQRVGIAVEYRRITAVSAMSQYRSSVGSWRFLDCGGE